VRENGDVAKYCAIISKVFHKVSAFLTPQPAGFTFNDNKQGSAWVLTIMFIFALALARFEY